MTAMSRASFMTQYAAHAAPGLNVRLDCPTKTPPLPATPCCPHMQSCQMVQSRPLYLRRCWSLQQHGGKALYRAASSKRQRRRCRAAARAVPRAMVNVDFSPAFVLGGLLMAGGAALYQLRSSRPYISRDIDVVLASAAVFSGGILVFQGWRLDPILLFCQLLTVGAAVTFALEALRLRGIVNDRSVFDQTQPPPGAQQQRTFYTLPPADETEQPSWQQAQQQRDQQQGDNLWADSRQQEQPWQQQAQQQPDQQQGDRLWADSRQQDQQTSVPPWNEERQPAARQSQSRPAPGWGSKVDLDSVDWD